MYVKALNGLIDCVPFIMSIIIVELVLKLHLLAKNLSSYPMFYQVPSDSLIRPH